VFAACGIAVGSLLIIAGTSLSAAISWTLVRCANHYETQILEDIAQKTYGTWMSTFTSIMLILTLMGFMVTNTVLVKTMLP
jgi:hypothetical protein